jgi:hypothetical protein
MDFDGHRETVHLERGERFGIPPAVYQMLAQAAISASELGGIEPILIQQLAQRAGAMLQLYGRSWSFLVVVDCSISPPGLQLSVCELDAKRPFHRPIYNGNANAHSDWACVVSMMLEAEGFEGSSLDDLDAWNLGHGF